jgi:hypothetical protein
MHNTEQWLTETFTAHEHLTPDTADVLANVDAISSTHRRNRWVLRATGVSLLSAGVVVGGIGLPGLLSNGSAGHARTSQLAAAGQPATAPSHRSFTTEQEMTAYFNAGYDLDNAHALGKLWKQTDLSAIKAEAGGKLLRGQTLPVTPDNPPAPPENAAVNTFFADGYGYNDAVKLAALWHVSTYQAKIKGGKDLAHGQTLPVKPTGDATNTGTTGAAAVPNAATLAKVKGAHRLSILKKDGKLIASRAFTQRNGTTGTTTNDGESPAMTKYFDAGYDYNDAVKLGQVWNQTDINQVKSEAGQKLLNGDTLPVPPSGKPVPPENQAVATFFGDGYTYNDAVKLAKMWHVSSYQAKIEGGKKLENGDTLPVHAGS